MRFLHTSDWHVGKSIRGRSREEEFAAALEEVVGIAVAEGVDAVLLAGDVYEHRSVAPDADKLVFETLVRFREAGIPVLAIPGNHDSAARFEALGKLLEPLGTRVVHKPLPPERGGVVEVASRDGREAALVACVPFVPERRFASEISLFESTEAWFQSYAEGMGQLLAAMARAFRPDRVNVVMAHLFTDGALVGKGGGERELTIGMAYAVPPGRLPGTAAYCALGHVHKPQAVRGSAAPARYAGSLLQLDFGESEQGKSVVVVDASPGKPAKVREAPLTAGRPLLDLRGTFDQVIAQAIRAGDAYLRVFLEVDGPTPGIADRVREELPNALDVQLVYDRRDLTALGEPLSSLAPREQFTSYFRSHHGAEPAGELMDAFDEVLSLETEGA